MDASDLDNLTEFEDDKLQIYSFEHSNFQKKPRVDASPPTRRPDWPGWRSQVRFTRPLDQMLVAMFTKDLPS
jgi:hypothetical protein